jgi:hypothetical protein
MMYHAALADMFTNDPSLRADYIELFENSPPERRRQFIRRTHVIPPDEKGVRIRLSLIAEVDAYRIFRPVSDDSEMEQDTSGNSEAVQVNIADGLASQQNDTSADMYTVLTFTHEHFHCHIARYNPSMPHSGSARYHPSSHVLPARSNPLRFVKSAR